MEKFELRAERNRLAVTRKMFITSGSVNAYPVAVSFSADWDGLDKRYVFRAGGGDAIAVEPDENGVCDIPWEVLAKPNKLLYAGVYGTKGEEIVLPTVWAVLGLIYQGTKSGERSGPPTPDAWQRLKDGLVQTEGALKDIEEYSNAAEKNADASAKAAAESLAETQRTVDDKIQTAIFDSWEGAY